MVVVNSSDLQTVVPVFLFYRLIDREPFLEDLAHLLEVVDSDSSVEAVFERVRELGLVATVPGDVCEEEAEGAHEVGVRSVPGEPGEPVVPIEGQPLAGSEDGGPGQDFRF